MENLLPLMSCWLRLWFNLGKLGLLEFLILFFYFNSVGNSMPFDFYFRCYSAIDLACCTFWASLLMYFFDGGREIFACLYRMLWLEAAATGIIFGGISSGEMTGISCGFSYYWTPKDFYYYYKKFLPSFWTLTELIGISDWSSSYIPWCSSIRNDGRLRS